MAKETVDIPSVTTERVEVDFPKYTENSVGEEAIVAEYTWHRPNSHVTVMIMEQDSHGETLIELKELSGHGITGGSGQRPSTKVKFLAALDKLKTAVERIHRDTSYQIHIKGWVE